MSDEIKIVPPVTEPDEKDENESAVPVTPGNREALAKMLEKFTAFTLDSFDDGMAEGTVTPAEFINKCAESFYFNDGDLDSDGHERNGDE